jgi:ABC-2 type transport system permease protein
MEVRAMNNLSDMIWIELRKAIRSRMPLWTGLGSLFMPLGIAFLIFVARNPQISQAMGLISAKANLVAYSATDWPAYDNLMGLFIAAGGFFLFVLIVSWIFGREFVDGTLKDLLAVPVPRGSILMAKFIVAAAWSVVLSLVLLITGLLMGFLINLPGGSPDVILRGILLGLVSSCLTIVVVLPFALFASIGRGYLLPIGLAVITLMATNFVALAGWGEYFPWAIPGLFAQAKSPLAPVSFWIVFLTGVAGLFATYLWWKYADQNR